MIMAFFLLFLLWLDWSPHSIFQTISQLKGVEPFLETSEGEKFDTFSKVEQIPLLCLKLKHIKYGWRCTQSEKPSSFSGYKLDFHFGTFQCNFRPLYNQNIVIFEHPTHRERGWKSIPFKNTQRIFLAHPFSISNSY